MHNGGMTRMVCVHSLAAHGDVGLKPFLSVWGGAVAPVPSLLLTGPGDMPGCRRFDTDVAGMLDGTLTAAAERGEHPAVFVGYLASAVQVDAICSVLDRHEGRIGGLIVDPVSGDHGRAYVARDLIAAWPRLLERAVVALPNVTEVELLAEAAGDDGVEVLRTRFPRLRLIVTGWTEGDHTATRYYHPDGDVSVHAQRTVPAPWQGAGDLFAALWTYHTMVQGDSPALAMRAAAAGVGEALRARAQSRRFDR